MENASKALLIAGAILLVIAIIAVAMGIFGTTKRVVNNTEGQIDNMSIQMHNQQFLEYEGIAKDLTKIKELVSVVGTNNENAVTNDYKVEIRPCGYLNAANNGSFNEDTAGLNNVSDITDFTFSKHYLNPKASWCGDGRLYDVKLLYNEKGIIYQINLYRYKK